MQRDLRRLADTSFDLVVIGAGFYGALAAWDATLRGLSVASIDRGDFGGATSFNNHKTLHGGLRSLQSLSLGQMRLFIRERRALARVAPHLVHPMPFIVPTYAHVKRSAAVMRVALRINDLVARDRHEGILDPALALPESSVVSRDECLRLNPVIDPSGVTGGAMWHDYQMHNTDRMTLSFVLSAAVRGAATANYVEATGVIVERGRATGVRVEDRIGGERFDIRARAVVNAAGPWATSVLRHAAPEVAPPAAALSRAMNIVTTRVEVPQGCGGLVDGRFLFMIPWRDVTLVGTSHDAYEGSPDRLTVTERAVSAFITHANEAFPGARLSPDRVLLVHRGLLPAVSGRTRHVALLKDSLVVDHARDGVAGLISMFGVRYTTARHTAAEAIDAVFRDRGVDRPPVCTTADTAVAAGGIDDKAGFVAEAVDRCGDRLPASAMRRLAISYGTSYGEILRLIDEQPDLAAPLGAQCGVTGAEIVHAVRQESAMRLSDALIRRTEAGSAGHPGPDAVARAAALMTAERGWSPEIVADEVEQVDAFYRLTP
jgi:glycerol-3-phosphate dehydrogenase